MTYPNQTIKVYRGDTAIVPVELDKPDGDSYDPSVTGIEIEWRMAYSPSGETLVRKSMSDGDIVVNSDDTGVDVPLTSADTDWPNGLYYHEMKVIDTQTGDIATVMTGDVVIKSSLRMGRIKKPDAEELALITFAPGVT